MMPFAMMLKGEAMDWIRTPYFTRIGGKCPKWGR
jgi:hypothetical protein